MRKRILSLLIVFCMVVTMLPTAAFATETDIPVDSNSAVDSTGLCQHHTEHTDECGYIVATEEVPCNHEHNENCGFIEAKDAIPAKEEIPCDKECIDTNNDGEVDHVEGCAYTPATDEIPAVEGMPCNHQHDDTCGYVPATDGAECGFECEECLLEENQEGQPQMMMLTLGVTDYGDFSVDVASGDDLTFNDGVLTFGEGEYTVSMKSGVDSTTNRIVVASGVTANITLNGVDIEVDGNPAFEVLGTANITLTDGTTNTLKSSGEVGEGSAGLQVADGAKLSIDGEGTLIASGANGNGGASGAGIGGGYNSTVGEITINGGNIEAKGGTHGAGIGSGKNGTFGTITINGGTVLANGADNGSAIGGGMGGDGGDVIINGGNIRAIAGQGMGARGIGLTDNSTLTIKPGLTVKGGSSEADAVVVTENYHSYTYLMIETPVTTYEVWVGDVQVTSSNKNNVLGDTGKTVKYDPDSSTLTLNGANIPATYSAPYSTGKNALTVPDGTIINVIADSSLAGGVAGDVGYGPGGNGGNGINGNVTIKGTAKLTVNGGKGANSGSNPGAGGTGISGSVTVMGKPTIVANGGVGGTNTMVSSFAASGKGISGTIVATKFDIKGGDTDTEITNSITSGSESDYRYITVEPTTTLPTAAEYAADDPAATLETDYTLSDTEKSIHIKTSKGAAWWSSNCDDYLDYNIYLDADIDVSQFMWRPIEGPHSYGFIGTFDGQGHSISGLTINTTGSYAGLFSRLGQNSVVKNVKIASGNIKSSNTSVSSAGGIAGYSYYSTILNCENHASVFTISNDSNYAGGIIGKVDYSSIKNCYNVGSITANATQDNNSAYAGGICGYFSGLSSQIENCYSTGTVSALIQNGASANVNAGGLVGAISISSIINSYYLQSSCSTGVGVIYGSSNITGCGTFDITGTLSAGTADEFNKYSAQTLTYGNDLLATLNGWVSAQAKTDYYTWIADNTTKPANDGYPVFGTAWVEQYTPPTIDTLSEIKTITAGTGLVESDFDNYIPTVTENSGTITAQGWQQDSIASNETESSLSFEDWVTGTLSPTTTRQYYIRYYVTYTDDSGVSQTIYSNHVKLDVKGHNTVLSVTANPETSQKVNTEVTLTATLTGYFAGPGVNGQTITFKNGTTALGTANLNASGVATLSWTPNTVGNYNITAEYNATAYNKAASSTALNYTVTADTNIKTGVVSGKVTDSNGNPVIGATVTIIVKIGELLSATTDAEGNYTILDVPYGIYYIEVSYLSELEEIKLVENVTVNSSNLVRNLQILEGRRNTIVAVGNGTPSVAVGNLSDNYDNNLTEGERDAVINGGTATLRLQAIKKNAEDVSSDKTLLEAVSTGKTLDFFIDLNVFKTIIDSANNTITNEQPLSTLASVIAIVIPIPDELQGKDGLSVYRVHDGVAQALAKDNADANGEYFTISADGKYLTIYTKSFSTYALGYTASDYTVTVDGSYASTSGAGNYNPNATVSINAGTRSGYSFNGWTSTDGVTFANANSASTTFVMPASNVTLTANWTYNGGSTGGGSAGGGSSYGYYEIKITKEGKGTISPDGGSNNTVTIGEMTEKTFTFNPEKGYEVSDVLVDGKSVGAKESYTFKDITKNYTLKVIFNETVKDTNTYEEPQTDEAFDDVNEKDWFADAVYIAVKNGWFSGTSKNTFSPYVTTTRGMIATVLYRMEKEPTVSQSNIFADVLEGQYYTNGVNWAQANGIVAGYGNGKFGPQDNITREQMAAILYRYAQFKGYDMSKTASLDSFTDGDFTSQYAKTSMAWAVANQLITGKGNGILDPKAGATRGEVATILTRFDEMLTEK